MYAVAAAAGIENADRLEEAQRLATVEERERIAHDLHDDLGQLLGFLTAKIQAAQELVATDRSAQAAEELAGLESASRSLSAQVREAILGLRTSVGPDRPLGRALEEYTAEFGIQAGLRTHVRGPDRRRRASLAGPARYQALRIAQEALSNVRRHAEATLGRRRPARTDGVLEISVRDDGIGFDPAAAAGSGRFGLKTMRERAQAVGGTLEVRSVPGERDHGARDRPARVGWAEPCACSSPTTTRSSARGSSACSARATSRSWAQASDGSEAVALARELTPDVVLMDLTMPGWAGSRPPA